MDDLSAKRKRAQSSAQEDSMKRQFSEQNPPAQLNQMQTERPWHADFPEPTLMVDAFPARRALMILSMRIASILIIDVRRNDYEGGCIRGSLNIPAQGFWWNRGMLYELAYKSDMEWVVFTCGSSNGRAPRCAAWFLEHVRNTAGDKNMHVAVLEGGIKGWVKAGPQYCQFMDGFKEEYWVKLFEEENRMKEAEAGAAPVAEDVAMAAGPGDVMQ